jgi:hypothetical protein
MKSTWMAVLAFMAEGNQIREVQESFFLPFVSFLEHLFPNIKN